MIDGGTGMRKKKPLARESQLQFNEGITAF